MSSSHLKAWESFIDGIRRYFKSNGFTEVFTNHLNVKEIPNKHIKPFRVDSNLRKQNYFLHTSPELEMKKLLANGSGNIFQICKVFRDDEIGPWHKPEFNLLEWYQVDITINDFIKSVTDFMINISGNRITQIQEIDFNDIFNSKIGEDYPSSVSNLIGHLSHKNDGMEFDHLNLDELIDLFLIQEIEENSNDCDLLIIKGFPSDLGSMASLDKDDPGTSTRFEIILNGSEIANGYEECTDPEVLMGRLDMHLGSNTYKSFSLKEIEKITKDLPSCCGVAIGLDRFFAKLTDKNFI